MSSIMSSQGVVLATAMAAFSGTLLLLLRLQKSCNLPPEFQVNPSSVLRPCLSSGERKGEKKKKKKVRFAKDVVDPRGDNEVFRRQFSGNNNSKKIEHIQHSLPRSRARGMPANRVALYNGILRDRVIHRMGYTY